MRSSAKIVTQFDKKERSDTMTDYEEDIIADILEKVSRLAEIIRDHTDQLNLTEKEKDDLIDIENITSYLTCKG